MSIVRALGERIITVAGEDITISAAVEQDDRSGQLLVHVNGSSSFGAIDERASLGSADGKDAFESLTALEVKDAVQQVLDNLRLKMGRRLGTMAKVKSIAKDLS